MDIKTLFLLGLISTTANAANFEFQNIRVGGTGCTPNTTQIVTSPDLTSASLIFQSFETHVPTAPSPKGGTNIHFLNCNVFLDIKLPDGQKLDSLEISYDMRGFANLDHGVSGSFKSYLISSNGLGTERGRGNQLIQEKNWLNTRIDQTEDFTISSTKVFPINSNCRDRNEDRVSIHLQHQLGSQIINGVQGTITMDSSDIKGGIRFKAFTSACRQEPRGPQGPQIPPTNPGRGRNCHFERINNRSQMICE